jgi:hypothetical protein
MKYPLLFVCLENYKVIFQCSICLRVLQGTSIRHFPWSLPLAKFACHRFKWSSKGNFVCCDHELSCSNSWTQSIYFYAMSCVFWEMVSSQRQAWPRLSFVQHRRERIQESAPLWPVVHGIHGKIPRQEHWMSIVHMDEERERRVAHFDQHQWWLSIRRRYITRCVCLFVCVSIVYLIVTHISQYCACACLCVLQTCRAWTPTVAAIRSPIAKWTRLHKRSCGMGWESTLQAINRKNRRSCGEMRLFHALCAFLVLRLKPRLRCARFGEFMVRRTFHEESEKFQFCNFPMSNRSQIRSHSIQFRKQCCTSLTKKTRCKHNECHRLHSLANTMNAACTMKNEARANCTCTLILLPGHWQLDA